MPVKDEFKKDQMYIIGQLRDAAKKIHEGYAQLTAISFYFENDGLDRDVQKALSDTAYVEERMTNAYLGTFIRRLGEPDDRKCNCGQCDCTEFDQ